MCVKYLPNNLIYTEVKGIGYIGVLTENDIVFNFEDGFAKALVENDSQGIIQQLSRALFQSIERDTDYRRLMQESDDLHLFMTHNGGMTTLTDIRDNVNNAIGEYLIDNSNQSEQTLCNKIASTLDISVREIAKCVSFLKVINQVKQRSDNNN